MGLGRFPGVEGLCLKASCMRTPYNKVSAQVCWIANNCIRGAQNGWLFLSCCSRLTDSKEINDPKVLGTVVGDTFPTHNTNSHY